MGRFLGFVRSGIDAGRDLSQTMSSLVVALKYEDRVKQDRIEWRAYHYMRSNIGAKIFYALSASHRVDVVEQPIVLAFCEASLHSMFVCVCFFFFFISQIAAKGAEIDKQKSGAYLFVSLTPKTRR